MECLAGKRKTKKKKKKTREPPFLPLVYFTSFVPEAHSTQPSLWGPQMWDSYRRVEHLWDHPGKCGRGPRWSVVAKKGLQLPGKAAQACDPSTWGVKTRVYEFKVTLS